MTPRKIVAKTIFRARYRPKRACACSSDGAIHAIEDRCSHDDGPLCEGEWEPELCVVVCPRHGSRFDLETGIPLTLPAFESVPVFAVVERDGMLVVELPD